MMNLGNVVAESTVRIPFNSFNADGASVTISDFAIGDIKIYKDGASTDRASTDGYTITTNLDGNGLQSVTIDLSDDDDPGFYEVGSSYDVAVNAVTIDGETVRFWVGRFAIENTKVGSRIKKIHRGIISIAANAATGTVTLSQAVDVANCELFNTGWVSGNPANSAAYLSLSSTQVTATRSSTHTSGSSVAWQVTEWEPF